MATSGSYAINRDRRRKIYHYERNSKQLFDVVISGVTRSFDSNSIVIHRDFYLIRDHPGDTTIVALPRAEYDEDYIGFTGQDNLTKTFNITFSQTPLITLNVEQTGSYNINAFVMSASNTALKVGLSAPHSGNIRYRAIYATTYPTIAQRNVLAPTLYYTASVSYVDVAALPDFTGSFNPFAVFPSNAFFSTYDTAANNQANVAFVTTSFTMNTVSGNLSAPMTDRVNCMIII